MHIKAPNNRPQKSALKSASEHLSVNKNPNHRHLSLETKLPAFMTTAEAAKLLSLSMATVQKLVDNNSLQAWKTFGGHRRISLASVLSYQDTNHFTKYARSDLDAKLKMMLVLEAENSQLLSPEDRAKWNLPIMATYFDSVMEAILELASEKYDLLVLQLTSPRDQQEKTIEVLQKLMRSRQNLNHALILTAETGLILTGETGESEISLQVLNQSLSPEWLSAYLSGFVGHQRHG